MKIFTYLHTKLDSLQTDFKGGEGQIDNVLLIEDRNKWTQGIAHNYKMSETQMSCKWDGLLGQHSVILPLSTETDHSSSLELNWCPWSLRNCFLVQATNCK